MNLNRFKMVPACYLIFIKGGKILLLKRQNTGHFDGYYSVPAGHLDGNETFTQAAIREAKEEVNLDLKPENLKVVHMMNRNEKDNPIEIRERVDVFLVSEDWQGEIQNNEPEKCSELLWADLDNLPDNTIPYIKACLYNIKNKIFYSEWGY